MAMVKRHPLQVLLLALIVLVAGLGFWFYVDQAQSQAPPEAAIAGEPIELAAADYQAVDQLRRELALTNRDLAAMGCDAAAVEQTLRGLVQWRQANKAGLDGAKRNERTAKRNLRDAMRRINVGPRDQTLLTQVPTLVAAQQSAKSNHRQLIDQAAVAVSSNLSTEQQRLWTTARRNKDAPPEVPSRFRYVSNLSAGQIEQLRDDLRAGRLLDEVSQHVLLGDQALQLQNALNNVNQTIERVGKTVNALLPIPEELKVNEDEQGWDLEDPNQSQASTPGANPGSAAKQLTK